MAKATKIKVSELIPDDKNNNKHTAYGMDLLEKSVNKVGVIESITISNDDKIISGNARHEVIGKHFEKEALVIETDGTQPIIIKRTDIESDTKQFYEASILANTTAKKNIDFDIEVIDALAVEYDIDVVDLGVDIVDYTKDSDEFGTEFSLAHGWIENGKIVCYDESEIPYSSSIKIGEPIQWTKDKQPIFLN